jgi:hypothetical protein
MQCWYSRIVAIGLGLAVLGVVPAMAQNEIVPTAKIVDVDWPEVAQGVLALSKELAAPPPLFTPKQLADVDRQLDRFTFANKDTLRPLAILNVLMDAIVPGVANVPIPVLATIDTGRYVSEAMRMRQVKPKPVGAFLSPTISKIQFLGKSTGYDIFLSLKPSSLGRYQTATPLNIHLGGTGILYEVDNPDKSAGDDQRGTVVEDKILQDLYPRLRRNLSDDGITYSFVKYGIPYFANISCSNETPLAAKIAPCAEVEDVLRTVLRDLHLIGGAPLPIPVSKRDVAPRPAKKSPSFTYYAPGNLLPGSSQDQLGGVTQKYLWGPSDLLFPIKLNPAFANSQNFMHGGNCLGQQILLDHGRYKCRQNPNKILEPREDNVENYSYPWRDNYCEQRDDPRRKPKDCPARDRAHEGQDIRPRACQYDGTRCKINLFDVVAVTKGSAFWKSENNNVKYVAEDNTGVYFVYLHMDPDSLRKAGLKKDELVPRTPGQTIGKVGNWMGTAPHSTTAHLHFEIRNPNELCGGYGCTSAPYWTLIRAYERLIGMQGTEIQ